MSVGHDSPESATLEAFRDDLLWKHAGERILASFLLHTRGTNEGIWIMSRLRRFDRMTVETRDRQKGGFTVFETHCFLLPR